MSDVEFSYSSYSFIQINRGSLIRAQSSEWSILYGACRVLATSWNHLEPVNSSIPCAFAALLVFLSPGDMTGWVTMIAAFPEATHTQDIAVWKASHETSSGQHCTYHGHGGTTWHYRVTICDLPSGKLTVCCGKSASLIGKSTSINYKCAILNCYVAMWVITRDDFLISHGTPVSRYHLLTKPADSVRPRCTFAGKSSDGGVAWVNQGKLQAFRVSRPRVMVMTTNIIYKQWWLLVTIGDYSWL